MKTQNKPSPIAWIVILVVLALIIASLAYVLFYKQTPAQQSFDNQTNNPQTTNQQSNAANTQPQAEPGKYIDYSIEAFDHTTTRRVLFFHANWCPQCRQLDQDITKTGVPGGMTIFKVNYDNSAELKQKYSITLQTTFVEVDSTGNMVTKYVAYDQPTMAAVLKALNNQ